ncbi:hypothetical protein AWC38_SpisGene9797 [Stylophora pistillata]|uniref:Apolipoprotein L3 n=1 Tax=Stylophora pistillata TaxID=50429 RepID=A0A2B4S8W9_STYPI|nr:hypothetical protein AWC38_SpisGene9797 [Stylophora pistillata]
MSVSKVIELILTKLGLKEVQEAIDEDREALVQLQEKLDNLEKIISDLRESNGSAFLAQREFTTSTEEKIDVSARFFRVFSSTASVGAGVIAAAGDFARAGGSAGVRAASLAGGIVGAVLLPFDIYMLVKSSLEMHRGSTTQVAKDIRELLSELEFPEEEDIQEMRAWAATDEISIVYVHQQGDNDITCKPPITTIKTIKQYRNKTPEFFAGETTGSNGVKTGLKEVQKAIDEDRDACTQLKEKLDRLEKMISDLRGIESNGFAFPHNLKVLRAQREFTTSTEEKVDFSARFLRVFSSTASVGAGTFAAAGAFARAGGLAGVRVANLAGGIVGAVLLPLDIYMLVKSSLEVHKGSTTQAVQDIRELLSKLECPEEEDIRDMVKKFIAEKFLEAFIDEDSNEAQRDDGDDKEKPKL